MNFLDLQTSIMAVGYLGFFAIIFAESGLFFGFFLPGDSLLLTAGFLASRGYLDIFYLVILAALGAILGDNAGYSFGRYVGPKIFRWKESRFFHPDHVRRAEAFFHQHGPKALILARFLPVIRTFTPIMAGVGAMQYDRFLKYNIVGGILWGVGLLLVGYFLGNVVPGIDQYIVPIILVVIFISFLPAIRTLFSKR